MTSTTRRGFLVLLAALPATALARRLPGAGEPGNPPARADAVGRISRLLPRRRQVVIDGRRLHLPGSGRIHGLAADGELRPGLNVAWREGSGGRMLELWVLPE